MLRQSMINLAFSELWAQFFLGSQNDQPHQPWPKSPGTERCWNAWYVHLDSWHFNRGGAALTLWHALTSLAQNGDVSNLSMNQLILFQLCNCDSTATYIHIHPLAFISATFLGFQCHTAEVLPGHLPSMSQRPKFHPFGYHSMLCLDDGRLAPAVFQTKSQCKLWKICCYISDIPLVTLPKILWNLAIPYFFHRKKGPERAESCHVPPLLGSGQAAINGRVVDASPKQCDGSDGSEAGRWLLRCRRLENPIGFIQKWHSKP